MAKETRSSRSWGWGFYEDIGLAVCFCDISTITFRGCVMNWKIGKIESRLAIHRWGEGLSLGAILITTL